MSNLDITVTEKDGQFWVLAIETRIFASITEAEEWAHGRMADYQRHVDAAGGVISYDVSSAALAEMDKAVPPFGGE